MIRKPAPLNTTKLRHPKVQNRSYSRRIRHSKFNLKGGPPPAPPTVCHSERSEESLCHGHCHTQNHREILRFAQNDTKPGWHPKSNPPKGPKSLTLENRQGWGNRPKEAAEKALRGVILRRAARRRISPFLE
jgi:hypothetical protein